MKNIIWDKENQSVRGSFVCLVITVVILLLIVAGAFFKIVAENLQKEATLIGLFFASAFGVWRVSKAIEYKKENHASPKTGEME